MTGAGVLATGIVLMSVLLVSVAVLTVTRRALRRRGESRRDKAAAPVRPVLMRLVAGEPEESADAVRALTVLDARTWAAVEPTLEGLLLKLRGDGHAAVIAVLERRGTLERALARTRSSSPVTRSHGAEVLGAAQWGPAVGDLLRLLQDDDGGLRRVATRALGRIGAPEAAAPLLATLSHARAVPAQIVATALLGIGTQAYPALLATLTDGDVRQRAIAAEVAGLAGAAPAVPTLVSLLRDDPDEVVRVRCAQALGRIGLPWATSPLVDATADDRPSLLRVAATRALGDVGSPEAVPRLADLLTDVEHHVAAGAAQSLLRCGPAGALALRTNALSAGGCHARDVLAMAVLRGDVPGNPALQAGAVSRQPVGAAS